MCKAVRGPPLRAPPGEREGADRLNRTSTHPYHPFALHCNAARTCVSKLRECMIGTANERSLDNFVIPGRQSNFLSVSLLFLAAAAALYTTYFLSAHRGHFSGGSTSAHTAHWLKTVAEHTESFTVGMDKCPSKGTISIQLTFLLLLLPASSLPINSPSISLNFCVHLHKTCISAPY
jgi:hypothetical protein